LRIIRKRKFGLFTSSLRGDSGSEIGGRGNLRQPNATLLRKILCFESIKWHVRGLTALVVGHSLLNEV
jgi:hypothetical protein